MNEQQTGILDATGKPARKALDTACPKCGGGPEKRVPSGGFGTPWTVCGGDCGYEWKERPWKG